MTLSQITKLKIATDGSTGIKYLVATLKSDDFEEGSKIFIPDLSTQPTIETLVDNVFTLLNGGSLINYLVFDTFTDTNGTALVDHTPETDVVGNGWLTASYYGDGLTIQDNAILADIGETGSYIIDVGVSSEIEVEYDVTAPDDLSGDYNAYTGLASDSDAEDNFGAGYRAVLIINSVGAVGVVLHKAGVVKFTEIPLTGVPTTWLASETHTVKLSFVAGLLSYSIDGIVVASWMEDGVPLTGTYVGGYMHINYYSTHIDDNFKVIDLS